MPDPTTHLPPETHAPPAAAAKPRRRWAAKLLAACFGLTLALVTAEIAVRVLRPQQLSGTWRIVTPRGYPVNRDGGESRHDGPWGTVRYRFNDLHLRGPELAPQGQRVLCLGDSFTFGWGLPEDETYVGRLQAKADERFGAGAFQVLNGGCGGWGTAQCVAFTEDFGDAIRPDAVLVFLNSWDVGRSLWGGPFLLTTSDPPVAEPRATPVATPRTTQFLTQSSVYQWFLEHSHVAQVVRNIMVHQQVSHQMDAVHAESAERLGTSESTPPADSAKARDDMARAMGTALFRRLAAWCDAHHAVLWVATTGRQEAEPAQSTTSGDFEATLAFKKIAPDVFADLRVPYFDLAPDIAAACAGDFSGLVFSGDGHPTAKGTAHIADAAFLRLGPLFEGLRERKR